MLCNYKLPNEAHSLKNQFWYDMNDVWIFKMSLLRRSGTWGAHSVTERDWTSGLPRSASTTRSEYNRIRSNFQWKKPNTLYIDYSSISILILNLFLFFASNQFIDSSRFIHFLLWQLKFPIFLLILKLELIIYFVVLFCFTYVIRFRKLDANAIQRIKCTYLERIISFYYELVKFRVANLRSDRSGFIRTEVCNPG